MKVSRTLLANRTQRLARHHSNRFQHKSNSVFSQPTAPSRYRLPPISAPHTHDPTRLARDDRWRRSTKTGRDELGQDFARRRISDDGAGVSGWCGGCCDDCSDSDSLASGEAMKSWIFGIILVVGVGTLVDSVRCETVFQLDESFRIADHLAMRMRKYAAKSKWRGRD